MRSKSVLSTNVFRICLDAGGHGVSKQKQSCVVFACVHGHFVLDLCRKCDRLVCPWIREGSVWVAA